MSQWGFYFNQDRCIGCKACVMACKNWNDARRGDAYINPLGAGDITVPLEALEPENTFIDSKTGETNTKEYRKYHMKENWRRVTKHHYGKVRKDDNGIFETNFDVMNLSVSCNHCDKPACLEACPVGAYKKDPDTGIVLRSSTCLSCGMCKQACPWEAPQFYDDPEKYSAMDDNAPKATKCTLCYDRVREGLRPACVAACLNRALDADEMSTLKKRYPNAVSEVPEFAHNKTGIGEDTKPNILFKPKKNKTV